MHAYIHRISKCLSSLRAKRPPCPSDSKVRQKYKDFVTALEELFIKKSSTKPAKEIDFTNFFGVVKGNCKFCEEYVYQKPHWAKRIWDNGRYSHGDNADGCRLWKAYLENLKETTMAKEKPRHTSSKVWKFIHINPLTIMLSLIMVLIFIILWITGWLYPLALFLYSILEYFWKFCSGLFQGMLCPSCPSCPCGNDWNYKDWVPAEVAEDYVGLIASLKTELERARFQQNHTPGPEFKTTPEPATTSMSSAMLVAMNLVTAAVTGTALGVAFWAFGANPELATVTGASPMSMPGCAALNRLNSV